VVATAGCAAPGQSSPTAVPVSPASVATTSAFPGYSPSPSPSVLPSPSESPSAAPTTQAPAPATATAAAGQANPPAGTSDAGNSGGGSGSCGQDYYLNSDGVCVHRPVSAPGDPAGATARCVDGTYSFSKHRQGTCSHRGGVAEWL
jgi:hypothetical protein